MKILHCWSFCGVEAEEGDCGLRHCLQLLTGVLGTMHKGGLVALLCMMLRMDVEAPAMALSGYLLLSFPFCMVTVEVGHALSYRLVK